MKVNKIKINNKIKFTILLILLLSVVYCKRHSRAKKETEIIRPVKIEEIRKDEGKFVETKFPGQVVATNKTLLSFKYSGIIKSIKFETGDFVKKGETIVLLDPEDYELKLNAFMQKYEAAKAMAKNAEAQFARAKKLYEGEALTKKDFDNISAKKDVALASLKEAQVGLKNAKNTLKDTKIGAPYDGYVDKKIEDVGTTVGAGKPVVSFIANDRPNVSINISARELIKFENFQKIIFKENNTKKSYDMKIKSIGKNPDLVKLTYPVSLDFKENELTDEILIGETGDVFLTYENKNLDEVSVPLSSVFEDSGENVYLYKDGVAKKTKVKLGELCRKDRVYILDGLKVGDKVITGGISKLFDGKKVKLLNENKIKEKDTEKENSKNI